MWNMDALTLARLGSREEHDALLAGAHSPFTHDTRFSALNLRFDRGGKMRLVSLVCERLIKQTRVEAVVRSLCTAAVGGA